MMLPIVTNSTHHVSIARQIRSTIPGAQVRAAGVAAVLQSEFI
jgi:hypothetical protein